MESRAFVVELERAVWEFMRTHPAAKPSGLTIVLRSEHLARLRRTAAIGDLHHDLATGEWVWKGIAIALGRDRTIRIRFETDLELSA